MSKKDHRSGGKVGGTHTTVIPAAGGLVDIAVSQTEVTKVVLGFISAGLPSVRGKKRVKLSEEQGTVALSVRDNVSLQMIRVYTTNVDKTLKAIAQGARRNGLHTSFKKVT